MGRKQAVKKEIDLSELPKRGKLISWKNSSGYKIKGIYDDIEFEVEIIKYDKDTGRLTIKYKNKIFNILACEFAKCGLGKILGKITNEFKIQINTLIQDNKRDIIIIDREIRTITRKDKGKENRKYYKYCCNKDGYEGWIEEGNLLQGNGCLACCKTKSTPILDINLMYNTDPWMIPYVGEEIAKTHTSQSSKKVQVTCPDCGHIKSKKVRIADIYKNHSIGCNCSDKISFGEKTMFSILEQLKIQFQTQLSKTRFNWCNKYYYDFYFELNKEQYICEINGIQHYEQTNRKGARTLKEEQENDRIKKELALANGIKPENYIVLDCRYSEFEFIKQNILNSKLNKLFDLSKIDWIKVEKFALSNRVKEACNLWNSGISSTQDIAIIMKLARNTITKYLKKGSSSAINWCNYDAKEEIFKGRSKSGKMSGKPVEMFKDGISLGVFESLVDLERRSEKLFGIKLLNGGISDVCLGKQKQYKGYTFRYTQLNK